MPSEESQELRVSERDGMEELSRMTAEFESFVKETQNEPQILLNGEEMNECVAKEVVEVETQNAKVQPEAEVEKLETKQIVVKPDIIQSIENKTEEIVEIHKNNLEEKLEVREEIKVQETPLEVKMELIETKEQKPIASDIQIVEIKSTEIMPDDQVQVAKFSTFKYDNRRIPVEEVPQLVITETKILKIEEPPREPSPPVEVITVEVHQLLTEIRSFPDVQHLTPTPTPSREVTPDYIPTTVREKFHVLRIDEDEIESNNCKEELEFKELEKPLEIKEEPQQSPKPEPRVVRDRTPIPLARTEVEDKLNIQGYRKVTKTEFLNFENPDENVEIRRKDSSDELLITEGDEQPKTSERRRSVKEIIESINRQQQKLKINQPPTPQFERKFYYGEQQKFSYHEKPAVPSKENVMLKLKRQEEHERRINELLDDLQGYTRDNSSIHKTQKFPLSQRDSNNNSFISRSSDVNPIPKPRRAV